MTTSGHGRVLQPGGADWPARHGRSAAARGARHRLRADRAALPAAQRAPPASVTTARDGKIRLFMEFEALTETLSHLPRFAEQFGVTVAELRRMLAEDWLPHIQVVKLPPSLRKLDPRAADVCDKDADDYPAAALAALLSPCILLTHNHKDFAALGVHASKQGVDAVWASSRSTSESCACRRSSWCRLALSELAIAGGKWAAERIGPKTVWAILIAAAACGILWYCAQPTDRRERIKDVAGTLVTHYTSRVQRRRQRRHPGPGRPERPSRAPA